MAKYKPYRYLIYGIARLAAWLFFLLPRAAALSVARLLGRMAYALISRHRRSALQNLRTAFPEKSESETKQIACQVFENLAQTAAEVIQFPKLNLKKVERFVEIGNAFEIYDKLLSEKRGLISITSHIGNWELLAGIFALKGYQGKAVARKLRYPPFQHWIESLRLSIHLGTIYRDESPKKMFRLLEQNEILGVLPDQDLSNLKGVFVEFFGRPAYTSVAPVKLSLATGAPILTNFLIRLPGDRYRIVMGEVIRPVVTTTKEAAIFESTERWMQSCESMIRQYPEQWGWMHNRWKTTAL